MFRSLLLVSTLLAASAASAEMPQISDLHVELPPPGAPVAAGYMTLVNTADEPLVITGATSPISRKVELHRSIVENDVARMEKQAELIVEPGGTLTLEHGGYHLMFMGFSEPFRDGEAVPLTLDTSVGAITVTMPVGRSSAMSHGDHAMDDDKSQPMKEAMPDKDTEIPKSVIDVK